MAELLKKPDVMYTKTSKVYIGLYIFFIFGAAMGDWKVVNFKLGAIPKVISVGALMLAVVYLLWSGKYKNEKVLFRFTLLFSSIISGIVLCSILIWIFDLQTIGFIMKGVSKISYQFLNIAIVIAAVYMFEEKAPVYTFFGIAAGNFMIIGLGALQSGVGTAVNDMIRNITSFGASEVVSNSSFIQAIEIHDITFVMGVFVIYFLFFCHGEKYRYLYAAIAMFLFMAGLKRIAFLSLILAFAFAVFCGILGPKGKARTVMFSAVFIVIFCYFYISVIKSGAFIDFCNEHGVELNGRDRIYNYLSDYYTISPEYTGRGYEFCVHLLKSMRGTADQVLAINAVHNDILKMYIELGFWGFLLWILGYYVYQTHWYLTRCGEKTAVCFMTITIYMLISYLTDNTMFYYWSSMLIRMIPMAFFYDPVKEMPIKVKYYYETSKFKRRLLEKQKRDKQNQREPKMKLQK